MLRRRARAPARKPKSPRSLRRAKVTRRIMVFTRELLQPTHSLQSPIEHHRIHSLHLMIQASLRIHSQVSTFMVSSLETPAVTEQPTHSKGISSSRRICCLLLEELVPSPRLETHSEIAMAIPRHKRITSIILPPTQITDSIPLLICGVLQGRLMPQMQSMNRHGSRTGRGFVLSPPGAVDPLVSSPWV